MSTVRFLYSNLAELGFMLPAGLNNSAQDFLCAFRTNIPQRYKYFFLSLPYFAIISFFIATNWA